MNFPIFSAEFNGGRSAKAANLLFVGFVKNENSLESFSLIFENSSPKGFSWQNMKSDSSVLEANSRYLESPLLKSQHKKSSAPLLCVLRNQNSLVSLPYT